MHWLGKIGHSIEHVVDVMGKAICPWFLMTLRILIGLAFMRAGFGKWIDHASVVQFFTQLGIPLAWFAAWKVAAIELFGGLALVLGLFTRISALILSLTMLAAYLIAEPQSLTSLAGFIAGSPFLYFVGAFLLFTSGPGALSLDGWRQGRKDIE